MAAVDHALAFKSARSLAQKIRSKEIGALELLEHYLDRVEKYNPTINAIIFTQIEKARERAKAADTALARGEVWGELHGLPMTIKECFDWVGTPSTWGNPIYKDNYPKTDAVTVQRLEGAGAIIFGKTNVPLMLADWQSFNVIYGTTNNPWDLTRAPGGSSGGAAAALAAGLTGLEIGSDIGSSIRNPAHYCGIFGHKPTYGIVPCQGHAIPGDFTPTDINVCGPLARSTEDLAIALDVLTADKSDNTGWQLNLPAPRKRELKSFRVAVMLTNSVCAQDDELTDQLQHTVDRLAQSGVEVDDKARPDIDQERSHHVYKTLLRSATGARVPESEFLELREKAATRDADERSFRAYIERGATLLHRDWVKFDNEREEMRRAWADFFQPYDLLLCPTAASAAFPHDQEGERMDRTILVNGRQQLTMDQLFWAGFSGVVYLPATVAPAGLTRSGLPCGLQIVGPIMGDRTCIQFARLMEQELGGFAPPPGYE